MSIGAHIRDRFFQRYGHELTVDVLGRLIALAGHAADKEVDPGHADRERVYVQWNGLEVGLVWKPSVRHVFTFLPPRHRDQRIAWCLPRRKRSKRR